ncbi:aspartate/glutamate racemase family protein [Clostridia bacterium UC5.1-1D1]|uniref:aspartate/glutamate racemase family protein n=1 Tax=Agathobaculum massiliense TaxID=3014267 RepID=UPI0006C7C5B4
MVKISCVHTGAGAQIFGTMEAALKKQMTVPFVVTHITDPDIISKISAATQILPESVDALMRMYSTCADAGADIILNMCSSVGEVAEAAEPLLRMAGIHIVRIDNRMCELAAAKHTRIGVMATLKTTLEPSCRLLQRCAEKQGKSVEITELLADGAFGLDATQLTKRLYEVAAPHLETLDAIVLAQNSMDVCAEALAEQTGKMVYSSPRYAAEEVAEIAARIKEC